MQAQRNIGNGAQIGVMSSPSCAVAAGGALHQNAFLVAQRGGKPVDLGLGGDGNLLVLLQTQEASDAADEFRHILVAEGIVERQHRPGMHHLGEFFADLGADALGRTVGPHQQGKALLDRLIAAAQRIIGGVADGRRVFAIIAAVMLGDLPRQPVQLLFRLGGGEFLDRFHARLRAFFGAALPPPAAGRRRALRR